MNGSAKPREAGPELVVLQKWEAFTGWLLGHTGRWPKSARFTLTQRVENHALDIVEMLVEARYQPSSRAARLAEINMRLEPEALALQRELGSGTWRPGRPFTFKISDPKERTISAAPFRDRVVHHARAGGARGHTRLWPGPGGTCGATSGS